MRTAEPSLQPPRWMEPLLVCALPCASMRDVILGDLHEEFVHDVAQVGVRQARIRYVRRTAGIVAHAASDSLTFRSWAGAEQSASPRATVSACPAAGALGVPRLSVYARARTVGGDAGFAVLALFVLAVGIVVNTMLFTAIEPQGPRVSSAAGIGGVALLLACVVIAAIVMCAGPRWRRKPPRGI